MLSNETELVVLSAILDLLEKLSLEGLREVEIRIAIIKSLRGIEGPINKKGEGS